MTVCVTYAGGADQKLSKALGKFVATTIRKNNTEHGHVPPGMSQLASKRYREPARATATSKTPAWATFPYRAKRGSRHWRINDVANKWAVQFSDDKD